MMILALVLAFALQQPAPPKPAPPPATKKPSAAPSLSLEIKVTDRRGATVAGAEVNLEGPLAREGTTDANGSIVFRGLTAGTYRARVSHDRFLTLEKEVAVRAGGPAAADITLSPAPPPAAPPPPPAPKPTPTPPAAPARAPAQPRALSIPDLVSSKLPGREPVERVSVGCSGASASEVLRLRDGLEAHTHLDADEMIYIVAGEGTLTMGSNPLKVGPGWFSLVPRGVAHSLTRSGRNPIVLLSVVSGDPCSKSSLAP
jgi:mannose-6-phosphate isomerase-like protein (cupin superfamily)